jgi:hypothetical protein
MPSEPRPQPFDLDQIHADIRKLMAETMRVSAEIRQPSLVRKLYPTMLVGGLIGVIGVAIGVGLAFLLKFY